MRIQILSAAIVVAVILLALFVGRFQPRSRTGKYKARHLMTPNELEFFGRLVVALPEHYIFPQVAMSALLEASTGSKQIAHGDRLRIAQQRVDYVVCDRQCNVVAVVELDDRTHSTSKDKIRDERLKQGGIRTVRFQSRNKPTAGGIRAAVLPSQVAGDLTESAPTVPPAPAPARAPAHQ